MSSDQLSLSSSPLKALAAALGCRVSRCPPALDCQYSNRQLLDRVLARDPHRSVYAMVAARVLPRVHGRAGWTAQRVPRLDYVQEGRTVSWMLARGVTLADLDEAQRDGWLVLEHPARP